MEHDRRHSIMSDGEQAAHESATAAADAERRGVDSATASDGTGAADMDAKQEQEIEPGQIVSVLSQTGHVVHNEALVKDVNQETGMVTLLVTLEKKQRWGMCLRPSRKGTWTQKIGVNDHTLLRPRPKQAVQSEVDDGSVRGGGRNDDYCHQVANYPCVFVRCSGIIPARSVREENRFSPESLRKKVRDLSEEDMRSFRKQFDELEGRRNSITEAEFDEQWRALNR